MTVKILISIGTRPEAIKMAPLVHALRGEKWVHLRVLATAQHRHLLDQGLDFFDISADIDLDAMTEDQDLAGLTGRMLAAVHGVLGSEQPDLVLAQGDTTTVMATALACHYQKIPFGHVEAGLRTGNRYQPFPEEINRSLVGRLAEYHFAPTEGAANNLRDEGVPEDRVFMTGNTVIDALLWTLPRVDRACFEPTDGRRLILVTAHRRESHGAAFEGICRALLRLAERGDLEILYPVHLNPNIDSVARARLSSHPQVHLTEPLNYADFVAAMQASHLILTDSGGVQEEAPTLDRPVLVLRRRTERPEGVAAGCARLVGTDADAICRHVAELCDEPEAYRQMTGHENPYGDGRAAPRIVEILRERLAT